MASTTHPITGAQVSFAYSTLERWLYLARRAGHGDPLAAAGSRALMPDELQRTVCKHAAGNQRVLLSLCHELLAVAKNAKRLDEELYLANDERRAPARAARAHRAATLWREGGNPNPGRPCARERHLAAIKKRGRPRTTAFPYSPRSSPLSWCSAEAALDIEFTFLAADATGLSSPAHQALLSMQKARWLTVEGPRYLITDGLRCIRIAAT